MPDPVVLVGKHAAVASVPTAGMGLALDMAGKLSPSLLTGYPANAAKGLDGAGNWTGSMFKIYDTVLVGSSATIDPGAVIPAAFTHLRIEVYARGDTAATSTALQLRLNNDTGTNYTSEFIQLSAAASTTVEQLGASALHVGRMCANTAPSGEFSAMTIIIQRYAGATNHKGLLFHSFDRETTTSGGSIFESGGGSWFATAAAVNRITLFPGAGNFVADTEVTIYGLGV